MATIVPFTPALVPSAPPFQFQATLDGQPYNVVVKLNAYSQRWYASIFSLSDAVNPVLVQPLVGSGNARPLASLSWSDVNGGTVEAVALAPHSVPLGRVVAFTIVDAVPTAYNGLFRCVADSPSSFFYPLPGGLGPGTCTAPGGFEYDVNLVGGYFASTLVWRVANNWFEVSP